MWFFEKENSTKIICTEFLPNKRNLFDQRSVVGQEPDRCLRTVCPLVFILTMYLDVQSEMFRTMSIEHDTLFGGVVNYRILLLVNKPNVKTPSRPVKKTRPDQVVWKTRVHVDTGHPEHRLGV